MSKRSDARIRRLLASMAIVASDLSVDSIAHRLLDEAMGTFGATAGLLELTNATQAEGRLARGKGAAALADDTHREENRRLRVELKTRDQLFGRLALGPKNGRDRYSRFDKELAGALAGAAGVALENAQLYQDAADRARWLEATALIGALLGGERAQARGLDDVAELARKEARAKYALILTPVGEPEGEQPGRSPGEPETDPEGVRAGEDHEGTELQGPELPTETSYRISGISHNVHPSLSGRILNTVRGAHPERNPADGTALLQLASPESILPLGEIADGGPTLLTELRARDTRYGILLMIRHKGQPAYRPIETHMAAVFSSSAAQGMGLAQMHHLHEEVRLYLERERIARDLHDIVIQRIFAAGLSISALARHLPTPATRERAAGITGELDTTIAELRATIYSLRTSAGEHEQPSSRILRAIRLASEPLDFTPRVHLGEGLDTVGDEALLTHLLAVITESLSNAVRHARAGSLRVDVGLEDRALVLRVSDDGRGFVPGPAESGLANMRQRAAELGGTLEIDSTPGTGTTLRWSVPAG